MRRPRPAAGFGEGRARIAADSLLCRLRRQQRPVMNKRDQLYDTADGDGLNPPMIVRTMTDPGFAAGQLPGLWRQVTVSCDDVLLDKPLRVAWDAGIASLYARCETYPQHMEIMGILDGMPGNAWHGDEWIAAQSCELLSRATPDLLVQALVFEQTLPGIWKWVDEQIVRLTSIEQLTGPVVEQLLWRDVWAWILDPSKHPILSDAPPDAESPHRNVVHIIDHVQKQLLGGDIHAWEVFLGIVESGTVIGEAAELAVAVELRTGPPRLGVAGC